MSLFRQGKRDEARQLADAASANMKPLPKDEKNPLADKADHDDLGDKIRLELFLAGVRGWEAELRRRLANGGSMQD